MRKSLTTSMNRYKQTTTEIHTTIRLTDTEITIFEILTASLNGKSTVARVAGGWVRDKVIVVNSFVYSHFF